MVEIGLKVEGRTALLDFGSISLGPEEVEDRLRQLLPILEHLLDADVSKMLLTEEQLRTRFRAFLAQEVVVDAGLWSVRQNALLLGRIITGSESIADHGFPEFADE